LLTLLCQLIELHHEPGVNKLKGRDHFDKICASLPRDAVKDRPRRQPEYFSIVSRVVCIIEKGGFEYPALRRHPAC
jgi:hypothetical protein